MELKENYETKYSVNDQKKDIKKEDKVLESSTIEEIEKRFEKVYDKIEAKLGEILKKAGVKVKQMHSNTLKNTSGLTVLNQVNELKFIINKKFPKFTERIEEIHKHVGELVENKSRGNIENAAKNTISFFEEKTRRIENDALRCIDFFMTHFLESTESMKSIESNENDDNKRRIELTHELLNDQHDGDDFDLFDIEQKKPDIVQILMKDKLLENVMKELVPLKMTYVKFWYRFFKCQFDYIENKKLENNSE